jgi:hypothetical protein
MFRRSVKLELQLGECVNMPFRSGGIRSCLRARGAMVIMLRRAWDYEASE